MTSAHRAPDRIDTFSLDWGTLKWFVSPETTEGAASSVGEVIVQPGRGHAPHQHDDAEEVLYVISGAGRQTVGDEEFDITEGDAVLIPRGVQHSTYNSTWRPLRLLVTYTPGGAEQALTALPDFRRHPAGRSGQQ